jgi:serine phosphatase RsbU (regulator of sigma subunit)
MDEGPDTRAFQAGQGAVGWDTVDLDAARLYRAVSGVGIGLWDWDVASGRVLTDCAAARDIGIGGDWYDATVLANGTVSLVVGDVGGHGLPAVSTMAELRHAARAYALQLQPPADITTQLSANLGDRGADEVLATAVVAHLDPATGWLTWSCAGHPPPLLLATEREGSEPGAGGASRYLEEVHGPILGVDATAAYGQSSILLPPRAGLLLYSDGLVERRGRSLTDQLAALAEAAVAGLLTCHGPANLCDHILRAIAPPEREDDLCLLAVATR